MNWNDVECEQRLATKKQRQAIHISADEMKRHPERAKLLTWEEADTIIRILVEVAGRQKQSVSKDNPVLAIPTVAAE